MRVLMTGATGFLGSYLARAFLRRGDEVHAVRRTASNLARLGAASGQVSWHDVAQDPTALTASAAFDVVLHAATHYGRAGAVDADVAYADVAYVNYDWPLALLGAAGASGIGVFANIDTSLPPSLSTYASTKRRFVDRARELSAVGGSRLLNVGLESVYGPGDDHAKFQMALLHALLRGDPSFGLSPGGQTRDYIFIDDAVDAVLRLVDHAHGSSDRYLAAGVGRGEEVSIRHFAEMMRDLTGSTTRLDFAAMPYRAGELMHARADTALLRSLGWPGARTVERGLRETIARERTGT